MATFDESPNLPGAWRLRSPALHKIKIEAEPFCLDLGDLPTVVDPNAQRLINEMPRVPLAALLAEVRRWCQEHPEVERARFRTASEPEDADWTEVILELRLNGDTQLALELWAEIGTRLTSIKQGLQEQERALLNRTFGIHLSWLDDDEGS